MYELSVLGEKMFRLNLKRFIKNKIMVSVVIVIFFLVTIYIYKDDEIKLRNVDQISLESNSTMPERGDSVTLYAKRLPNTPEYILRIAKPEDYLFTK